MNPSVFTKKQAKLQQLRKENDLDAIIIPPSPNLNYLTGLGWHVGERIALACFSDRGLLWLVPELEASRVRHLADEDHIFRYSDHQDPYEAGQSLATALGEKGLRLGIDPLHMRLFEWHLVEQTLRPKEWIDVQLLIGKMRAVKDVDEVDKLKQAVALTETVLQRTIDSIRPGQSEREIALQFQKLAFESGAATSFTPIVASGSNGGNPHALPGDRRVREGDMITLDVGVIVDDYPGDITRNVALGEVDLRLEEIHAIVYQANQAGIAAADPGVPAQDVDRAAREVIVKSGYGDYFIHRTGHGLGLEVHEPPYIVEGNTTPLEQGNVFTVEPGIYLPDVGGVRIEDNCVITSTGVDVLTTFPRELTKIEC